MRSLHLARRKTVRAIGRLALEGLQVDVTALRVFDETVLHPILGVAGVQNDAMNHGVLCGRNVCGWVFESLRRKPECPGIAANVGWIAGHNAVELVGISISLKEPFTSAAGAAVPVGVAWIAAIEGFDEGLGFNGHFMFGAIGEVNELLRVPQDKAGAAAGVTIVCGTRGISTA